MPDPTRPGRGPASWFCRRTGRPCGRPGHWPGRCSPAGGRRSPRSCCTVRRGPGRRTCRRSCSPTSPAARRSSPPGPWPPATWPVAATTDEPPGSPTATWSPATCSCSKTCSTLPAKAADPVCDLLDRRASRRKAGRGDRGAPVRPAAGQLPRRLTSRLAARAGGATGTALGREPAGDPGGRGGRRKVRLTPDALDWLAGRATGGGVRPALGLLQNLAQVAASYPGPLDRTAVEQMLAGTGQPTSAGRDVAAIVKRVAAAFGVTEKELLGAEPAAAGAGAAAGGDVPGPRTVRAVAPADRGGLRRPRPHDRAARVPQGGSGHGDRRGAGGRVDSCGPSAFSGAGSCGSAGSQPCGKPGARRRAPAVRRLAQRCRLRDANDGPGSARHRTTAGAPPRAGFSTAGGCARSARRVGELRGHAVSDAPETAAALLPLLDV